MVWYKSLTDWSTAYFTLQKLVGSFPAKVEKTYDISSSSWSTGAIVRSTNAWTSSTAASVRCLVLLIALTIHTLFEGLAIGMQNSAAQVRSHEYSLPHQPSRRIPPPCVNFTPWSVSVVSHITLFIFTKLFEKNSICSMHCNRMPVAISLRIAYW